MEISTTVTQKLTWDYPDMGHFTATLVDNKLEALAFCRHGSQKEDSLSTTDLDYLRRVNSALTELFYHLDKGLLKQNTSIQIQEEPAEA